MTLAEKIHILRKARGLSQEDLGLSLSTKDNGVSRQTVSDWENGKSEPKLDNIRALAELLNVSYDVLLDEELDLNNQEYLSQVLNGTYQNSKSILDKENYYIHRLVFGVVPLFIMGMIIAVSLVIYFTCIDKANIALAISAKHNGDKSVFGQNYMTRGLMWQSFAYSGLVIMAIGVPLCIVFFIKAIRTNKPVGVLSSKELILYPKVNRTVRIPLSEIKDIKRRFLFNVRITLNDNKRVNLFFIKKAKTLVSTYKEYQM